MPTPIRYDPLNELANIINKHIIKPISPEMAKTFHGHRMGYQEGLNLTENTPTAMGSLGKFTRDVSDWWSGEGSKKAAEFGKSAIKAGVGIAPLAGVGALGVHLTTRGQKQILGNIGKQEIKIHQQHGKIVTDVGHMTELQAKKIGKTGTPVQGEILKGLLKDAKKLAESSKKMATGRGYSLGQGAWAGAIASVAIPVAVGLGLNVARLLTPTASNAYNKLGEWLHQFGDPYRVPTPAHQVHKAPPAHVQQQVHAHHHRNYYK